MTTYNLYKYRKSDMSFVVTDEEESDFNAKHLTALRESLQNGEIEFMEVFDSKEILRAYIKDNSITLWDSSQLN